MKVFVVRYVPCLLEATHCWALKMHSLKILNFLFNPVVFYRVRCLRDDTIGFEGA